MNYTTADYLTQLQQDRQDLVDNLETKGITGLIGDETFTELVPEVLNISGGGDIPTSKTFDELINNLIITYKETLLPYINEEKAKKADFVAYTNNAITLYTPNIDTKYYLVHKRANGKYRILWSNRPYACIWNSSSVGFCSAQPAGLAGIYSIEDIYYNMNDIRQIYLTTETTTGLYYYSNEFNTLQEIFEAITTSNGNIQYTQWTEGSTFSSTIDTPYKITCSNAIAIIDLTNNKALLTSRIFSKDETIVSL